MADLFPENPGAKGLTAATFATSADAADAITSSRERLARIAIRTLALLGEAAPFEVVAASGVKGCALQPRMSECIAEGLMEPTGERRRNPDTGKTAAVLTLTDLARERLSREAHHG
ncbi:MAG: hypothetical protein KGJ57_04985 [Sphingomonadales bacterium]|nr:hypothetical protein [Sphingomonadales bacterium]MDE2168771.1 hypothetical protein [Sphingomonadales bacterium]